MLLTVFLIFLTFVDGATSDIFSKFLKTSNDIKSVNKPQYLVLMPWVLTCQCSRKLLQAAKDEWESNVQGSDWWNLSLAQLSTMFQDWYFIPSKIQPKGSSINDFISEGEGGGSQKVQTQ